MAWTSGFFNSKNGDRTYNAEQMSDMFKGIITDGVFNNVGNNLIVEPNGGMTVQINTGRGFFDGRWCNNDSEYLMTLEDADVLLNRYCAVCVRVDHSETERKAEPYFKYSEFATTPVKPTMERTETVKEYCLAYIYIGAGVTEIKAADIEDTRAITELCGWITVLIQDFSTTTLWRSFENEFREWFDNLVDYLDENTEAKLVADVAEVKKNTAQGSTATITGTSWVSQEDGTYTQVVAVEGATPTNHLVIAPQADYKGTYEAMMCEAIEQGEGTITFRCTDPVDETVVVDVIIFNV